MPPDERDRQFERALQRHLPDDRADTECPDAETLAAYHERTLSLEELTKWKEHIGTCAPCQEVLALLEETSAVATAEWEWKHVPIEATRIFSASAARMPMGLREEVNGEADAPTVARASSPQKSFVHRTKWRWAVPAGALAAGLLVFVAIEENRSRMGISKAPVQTASNQKAPAPAAPETKQQEPEITPEQTASARKEKESFSNQELGTPPAGETTARTGGAAQRAANARKAAAPPPPSQTGQLSPGVNSLGMETEEKGIQTVPLNGRARNPLAADTNGPPPILGAPVPGPPTPTAMKKAESSTDHAQPAGVTSETVAVPAAAVPESTTSFADKAQVLRQVAARNPHLILAPDGKRAWRVGAAGMIESSSDAGINWKAQKSDVHADLTAGSAPSDKVCWVVGKAGIILLTSDGGKHWRAISSPLLEDLGGVQAVDAKHAAIWDAGNRKSFQTADGGITWAQTANE